jgi:osmotically-inducible protein OsmY
MKNNQELQKDVQNAIRWEPSMRAAAIGVKAKDGVITLTGTVDTYSNKLIARKTTKKIVGVRAITEDIVVQCGSDTAKTDLEIAKSVLNTWKNNSQVLGGQIRVEVEEGLVTLKGEVSHKFQEEESAKTIKNVSGIKGITNLIKVKSKSESKAEKKGLESAFERNWSLNSNHIKVEVNQNKVMLTGLVHSLYQKEEADRLAWNTPGVLSVENDLAVIN